MILKIRYLFLFVGGRFIYFVKNVKWFLWFCVVSKLFEICFYCCINEVFGKNKFLVRNVNKF